MPKLIFILLQTADYFACDLHIIILMNTISLKLQVVVAVIEIILLRSYCIAVRVSEMF